MISLVAEIIRQICLLGLSDLFYHLWWAFQVKDWIVTCNIVAFSFGWTLFLTVNMLPTLIEATSVPDSGLVVPFIIDIAKLSTFVWIVYSSLGDHGLLLFVGYVIAGLIGLISMISKYQTRAVA